MQYECTDLTVIDRQQPSTASRTLAGESFRHSKKERHRERKKFIRKWSETEIKNKHRR